MTGTRSHPAGGGQPLDGPTQPSSGPMLYPQRFRFLSTTHAPGQQPLPAERAGSVVDFSHGDVDAFPPPREATAAVEKAVTEGARWAYSPYRGHPVVRATLADRLARFTGQVIDPDRELLISAGTQAGVFLALSALVERGDHVAIATPDYFAYRKITQYLEASPVEVPLHYRDGERPGELDLQALRRAFTGGARTLIFSNPNNPTGVVYSRRHLREVCELVAEFDGFVVVDQLYCRQIFDSRSFTHVRSLDALDHNSVTLVGPSKTESLSGYRLGVAIGPSAIINRMESLQGLTTLRAPGYSQAALETWLDEPVGWLDERISAHQAIRDDLMGVIDASDHVFARRTEGGSYLFVHAPKVAGQLDEFVSRLRIEAGVVVTRGQEFGEHNDAVRLNFSQNRDSAVVAMGRLVQFVETFSAS